MSTQPIGSVNPGGRGYVASTASQDRMMHRREDRLQGCRRSLVGLRHSSNTTTLSQIQASGSVRAQTATGTTNARRSNELGLAKKLHHKNTHHSYVRAPTSSDSKLPQRKTTAGKPRPLSPTHTSKKQEIHTGQWKLRQLEMEKKKPPEINHSKLMEDRPSAGKWKLRQLELEKKMISKSTSSTSMKNPGDTTCPENSTASCQESAQQESTKRNPILESELPLPQVHQPQGKWKLIQLEIDKKMKMNKAQEINKSKLMEDPPIAGKWKLRQLELEKNMISSSSSSSRSMKTPCDTTSPDTSTASCQESKQNPILEKEPTAPQVDRPQGKCKSRQLDMEKRKKQSNLLNSRARRVPIKAANQGAAAATASGKGHRPPLVRQK